MAVSTSPAPAVQPNRPACDLCGHKGPSVRFLADEGAWLCKNSRQCIRRHWARVAEEEAAEARYVPAANVDELPF